MQNLARLLLAGRLLTVAAAAAFPALFPNATRSVQTDRQTVATLVDQIRKADYAGDRPELRRLASEISRFADEKGITARVQYWRGFAFWRSALNGFNDNAQKKELEQDLNQAVEAFDKSLPADPGFLDAKVGIASCLGLLAYSLDSESPERQQYAARMRQTLQEAREAGPYNPRLLWVLGPVYWNIPADRGGGQEKAIATYQRGLEIIRRQKVSTDPLDPSWGEPELLMSLAWSYLNRATPDVKAAEESASAALQVVPDWHYVRDILMVQVRAAKTKQVS